MSEFDKNMQEYLETAQQLVARIKVINTRLEKDSHDHDALVCLKVALADTEFYLSGLELMSFLENLRKPELESV